MNRYGSQSDAIKRAKALDAYHSSKNRQYAGHNPCTTVYKLVEQLIGQDETLNQELIAQVNK
jgi:hypothetical protein